jgi:tetratricopeptide (TPR) repeat protein
MRRDRNGLARNDMKEIRLSLVIVTVTAAMWILFQVVALVATCLVFQGLSTPVYAQTPQPPSGKGASPSGGIELDYVEKLIHEGMLDVAENELLRFMESGPSAGPRQRGALLLGDIKFAQSNLVEATNRYMRAYEANPRGESACDALYKAGQCRLLLHKYEEAISTFQKVTELFPECPQYCSAMTALGRAFFESGDYEQAAREFEETLADCQAEQKNAELLYWLGKAETRVNIGKARDVFENVRSAYPGTEAAFKASLELSQILFDQGNTQGSLDVLSEALSYKVDRALRARAFMKRGELLDLMGRPQDAAREYAECFSLSPDSSLCEACNLSSQKAYLSAGDYRQADLLAQKLLSGSFSVKARRLSLLTRARASRAQGKYQDALDFISKTGCARQIDSLCCSASVEEGEIREELSQFEGSVQSYLRALTLPGPDSLHATALMHLGDLCVKRTGDPDRALGYYNLLVDLYPESETTGRALYEIARLYEKKGEFSRASGLYRKLAGDFPLGPYADEALERAEILDSLFPTKIGQNELRKSSALLLSAASGSVLGDKLLEQAALLFAREFHSFEEARAMLEQAVLSSPPDRKPILFLRLSNVYLLLSKKLQFQGRANEAVAAKNEALKYLRDLVSQYSDSDLVDDAELLLIQDRLEKLSSPEKEKTAASLYTEFLKGYPNTDRFEEALLGRAQALMKLSREPGDESYNEAVATYDKLIQEFPRSPLVAQAHYEKGRMLAKAGDVDGAESEFDIVLASHPASATVPEAAYELAECKLAKRELDEAIALYTSAFAKARNRSLRERCLARKGDCLLVQGKLDEAIQEYEYILKRDPKGPFADDLIAKEAEAYLSRGMLEKASSSFGQLLTLFPKSPLLPKSLMRKAEAEALAGDFKKAQATYEQIEARFPESRADTSVMFGLAHASFEAGDYKSSVEAYEQVLKLDITESRRMEAARGSVLSLARIEEDGKVQKRLSWYEKNFPGDTTLASEIDFERGLSLFEKDQFEAAYANLSQAQAKLPTESRIRALVTMGMCKLKEKDFAQASSHFEEALELGPSDSTLSFTAYFKLGTSLYAQSKYDEASRAYVAAGTVCPDSSSRCEALYNAGLCIERTENWPEAASMYEKVAATCKGKLAQDAIFKSGYAYLNAGQRPKALELFKAALGVAPDDEKPEIQYWIGETYAAMGEFERAASEFLKVPYLYGEGSLWGVTARYKAGLAFEEAGNIEAATKQYKLLLEREGENSEWGSMAKERLLKLSK